MRAKTHGQKKKWRKPEKCVQHGQNDQGKKNIKSGSRGPKQWKNMVRHLKSEENMVKMTTKYCQTKSGCNSLNIACTDLNLCHMIAEVLNYLTT